MRDALRAIAVIGMALAAAASATSYQPKGAVLGHGYDEVDLGGGRFTVDFTGNGWNDMKDVIAYAHRRAGELCPRGYDMLDSHTGDADKHPQATITVRCR